MSDIPVRYQSALVGTIEVSAEGPAFTYDPSWVSVSGDSRSGRSRALRRYCPGW